jgi:valyl-tRNA synthetase
MKKLTDIITAIRNIRSVWNIAPKLKIDVIIKGHGPKDESLLSDNEDLIKTLSGISDLRLRHPARPKNAAASVVGPFEIYVPLGGLIDFKKEETRLKKEDRRIGGEIKAINARLKNKNFTGKAPKEVVEKQAERLEELELQVGRIRDNLKNIE